MGGVGIYIWVIWGIKGCMDVLNSVVIIIKQRTIRHHPLSGADRPRRNDGRVGEIAYLPV